jgi:GNAT superfamily N-acetyltransferase
MDIEPMTDAHAAAVLAIYQAGIDEGNATFETQVPTWERFTLARLPDHRYVAVREEEIVGWVAVSAVSSRPVYAGVVEHSVYVHPAARGLGVGRTLLRALISSTEAAGIRPLRREQRKSRTPRRSRVPRSRHPRADRPASRPLARRNPRRASQPGHLNAVRPSGQDLLVPSSISPPPGDP